MRRSMRAVTASALWSRSCLFVCARFLGARAFSGCVGYPWRCFLHVSIHSQFFFVALSWLQWFSTCCFRRSLVFERFYVFVLSCFLFFFWASLHDFRGFVALFLNLFSLVWWRFLHGWFGAWWTGDESDMTVGRSLARCWWRGFIPA